MVVILFTYCWWKKSYTTWDVCMKPRKSWDFSSQPQPGEVFPGKSWLPSRSNLTGQIRVTETPTLHWPTHWGWRWARPLLGQKEHMYNSSKRSSMVKMAGDGCRDLLGGWDGLGPHVYGSDSLESKPTSISNSYKNRMNCMDNLQSRFLYPPWN